MKAGVYSNDGKKGGDVELPAVFSTPVRKEIIARAVQHEQSMRRQPKGAYKLAGMQTTAHMRGRKEAYRAIKNKGISRLPRERLPKGRFGKVRIVPFAVGGRRAHPPNPEENLVEEMNRKEYSFALKSAIAATAKPELVKARGHVAPASVPVIVGTEFEALAKARDVAAFFCGAGMENELARGAKKSKSGLRSKRSGGKKEAKTVLIVVSEGAAVAKAARNLAGVDVCTVKGLKVELLAPGCAPGRLTVWSEQAIKELAAL